MARGRVGWIRHKMDTNPQEPAELDVRARRVRALIVVVALVLIAAPFVVYLVVGRGAAPGQ